MRNREMEKEVNLMYQDPEVKITLFETEDIITISDPFEDGGDF